MAKKLKRTAKGEHLKHETINEIEEAIEQTADIVAGSGVDISDTPTGKLLSVPPRLRLGLFELTEAMQLPDASRTGGSNTEPDVPWVDNCKSVWFDDTSYTEGVHAKETSSEVYTLYLSSSFLNAYDIGIGHQPLASGQRTFAFFNRQSGRWEILTSPASIWRFSLKTDLAIGSSAAAYLLNSAGAIDANIEFTVYDGLGIFNGVGSVGDAGGAHGYARWMADGNRWEVLQMECPAS